MVNLVLNKSIKYNKAAIYTFYYLTKQYDSKINVSYEPIDGAVNIFYGYEIQGSGNIFIPYREISYPKRANFNVYKEYRYINFDENIDCPYKKSNDNIIFNFDIIATSFYLISGKEESDIKKRDSINRFISAFSYRKDEINNPVFDVNSRIFLDALNEIDSTLKLKKNKFKIMLTHDVDTLNSRNIYVFLHNAKELVFNKHKPLSLKVKDIVLDVVKNRHLQIENCMKMEQKVGAKSEFYFLQGVKHRLGKRYELKKFKKEVDLIKDKGWVVGLHTNFFSYDDKEKIKQEISEIEKVSNTKILSCRNHYLRFTNPYTYEILSETGISIDTNLGYSDENGFRAATSQAFIPFNIEKNRTINIYEVPLILMEGIVMDKPISFEDKWIEIKDILDNVKKFGGCASVLWHDRIMYDEECRNMYIKVLNYVKENSGEFVVTPDLLKVFDKEKKDLEALLSILQ